MANATWKEVERRVARALGGRRVGPTGEAGPDVVVGDPPWLVVEVKHRATLPKWIEAALVQARAAAGDGQLGIAVLHERSRHDSLVVLALSDFAEWFRDPPPGGVGEVGDLDRQKAR